MNARWLLLAPILGATAWLASAGGSGSLSQDEQTLKHAGIPLDGPGLLEYFRRRTPSEAEQAALKQKSIQLGSSHYPTRAAATDELIRGGRASLPFLRNIAKTGDLETARRAQYCIQIIEQHTRLGLAATASRVLAERKSDGALEALLAYLPLVDESWVEDELRDSIKALGFIDGKATATIEQEHQATDSKRRGVAAWLLGASRDPTQRRMAVDRLADSADEVRFLAASSLLANREPRATAVLIALLNSESAELATRSEDLLLRLAGEKAPPVWLDPRDNNQARRVRDAWEAWWKEHQDKLDWTTVRLDEGPAGLTLIAENQRPSGGGRIYECTKTGGIRWQVPLQNPIDVQWLPGGRFLVADTHKNQLCEMDTRGNITWRHSGVNPTSVQRIPNGNTVISTYSKILEVTREGKTVFTHTTQGHTYHARKLPDGHYVWIDACGEVTEIDADRQTTTKIRAGSGLTWGSVERLRNGRYLVALGGIGKVQEIDANGKIHWERHVANPNRAIRLANGHTLVASHGDACVYEFDRNGNQRWTHKCDGRPFAVQRR